jgi:4-amino-4-deoxy-L-arabinose transferase-like glycosyltransferase
VAAVVVGGLLRLAWVIWATRTPPFPTDPSEYLRIALELSEGTSPRFGGVGEPSAYWSPGYPLVLSPFVWFADRTGLLSPAFAASLVNVAAGMLTIWLTALLADRWVGARTKVTAAWLVALWPSLIYYSSTAHTETVFTPVLLGAFVLAGSRTRDVPTRNWLFIGLLVGLGVLFRAPGIIGLAAPLLALRVRRGSWRASWRQGARATGIVLVGAAIVLVPWTVRNGVQVGIWSPGSTSNAAALCYGHNDDVSASFSDSITNRDLEIECFRGSPYDDASAFVANDQEVPPSVGTGPPDEVGWYQDRVSDAVRWALSHPEQEARLSVAKVWETWSYEGRVVEAANNYQSSTWAGSWMTPLGALANLWLWVVGALAIAGLALVPACRRALPIWVPVLLLTLAIVAAVAQPHYRFPVVPLVAILAAGFLSRHRLDDPSRDDPPRSEEVGGARWWRTPSGRGGAHMTTTDTGPATVLDRAVPRSEVNSPAWVGAAGRPLPATGHQQAMSLLVPMLVAAAVGALLLARGRTEAAFVLVVVVVAITQGRAMSPAFDGRFLQGLEAFGRGVGHLLRWVLLGAAFVFVFVPVALVRRLFPSTPLGRPRGDEGNGWIPRSAMAPDGPPWRTFGSEPARAPGARTPKLVFAGAVVAGLVVVDLAAGTLLTATGARPPIDRGDLKAQVEQTVMGSMEQPPINAAPWAQQHGRDMVALELQTNDFQPYIVRAHAEYTSPTINITDRERVSYEPAGVEPLRVAFFGGSVMFGVGQRDEHTIASAFSRIAEANGVPVEVHNYGYPAWVAWQEMQLFERRLAEDGGYDLAVFLDGFNDFYIQAHSLSEDPTHVGASVIDGLVADFREQRSSEPGAFDSISELFDGYRRASGAWRMWDTVQGRTASIPGADDVVSGTTEEQTDAALDVYGRALTLIEDLGEDSGTPVRFFWQPSAAGWPPEVLDRLPEGVIDLSNVFGGDPTPFYDEVHTDEAGAEVIAQAMWDQLGPELTAQAAGTSSPPISLTTSPPTD